MKISLEGPFTVKELRALRPQGVIDELHLSKQTLFHAEMAREVSAWPGIRRIVVWCTVTRAALRHLFSALCLEDLVIFEIRPHGSLSRMELPSSLQSFSCVADLSNKDLKSISRLPQLRELSAQGACISCSGIQALVGMKTLHKLDLEDTDFDNHMAKIVASSQVIDELELGVTRLTAKGLQSICTMTQLRALDIWGVDIQEADIDLLQSLPNLEYLSIGGYEGQTRLTAKGVLPRLAALPCLKRIWLDGISVTDRELAELEDRYETVRL